MTAQRIGIGELAPDFRLPTLSSSNFAFSTVAGHYIVLSFLGKASSPVAQQLSQALSGSLREYFDDKKFMFFGVVTDRTEVVKQELKQFLPGVRFFADSQGAVSRGYGVLSEGDYLDPALAPVTPVTFVLDPTMRVKHTISLSNIEAHNKELESLIKAMPAVDDHAGVKVTAPVLVVPRVLDLEFCKELIGMYESHGGEESGSMREKDGMTVGVIDHSFKRRQDYVITDEPTRARLRDCISRRLVPELGRAFQFRATYVERYIVARYAADEGGFFKPHRDNTTRGTAHRRFACTINLNEEEFEGGNLRFPEFGSQTYRAPTGGAVVFSCSLLHEATPVTKGVRYATLPFFYDEIGAKIRAENMKFLAKENTPASGAVG